MWHDILSRLEPDDWREIRTVCDRLLAGGPVVGRRAAPIKTSTWIGGASGERERNKCIVCYDCGGFRTLGQKCPHCEMVR